MRIKAWLCDREEACNFPVEALLQGKNICVGWLNLP